MNALFPGNAQAEWKAIYRVRKQWRSPRYWMLHCRREAALERKCEAQQRTIEALEKIIEVKSKRIDSLEFALEIARTLIWS